MISRRIIRIKVMQILYALKNSEEKSINNAEKELFFSINKSYDLYHLMLLLVVDFKRIAEEKIDLRKQKKMPSHEDLNPNIRFVENPLIVKLSENIHLNQYCEKHKVNWIKNSDLVKKLFKELLEQDFYKEYMAMEHSEYKEDVEFVEKLYAMYLLESEDLINELEE